MPTCMTALVPRWSLAALVPKKLPPRSKRSKLSTWLPCRSTRSCLPPPRNLKKKCSRALRRLSSLVTSEWKNLQCSSLSRPWMMSTCRRSCLTSPLLSRFLRLFPIQPTTCSTVLRPQLSSGASARKIQPRKLWKRSRQSNSLRSCPKSRLPKQTFLSTAPPPLCFAPSQPLNLLLRRSKISTWPRCHLMMILVW